MTLAERVAAHPSWYHTLDLGQGVVTPGWFDLRPILERMPWPDVAGKRCLDVGPYDGQLAFELERRGAAEVIATDISDPSEWDWSLRLRSRGPDAMAAIAGPEPGAGFELAKEALGSAVKRIEVNVYELDPRELGHFDVVVCGSLLLHLREPVRALESIRSVTDPAGSFLSAESISAALTLMRPNEPSARFERGEKMRWWTPNRAGHKALLEAGGFEIEHDIKPYLIPYGPGHPVLEGRDDRAPRARLANRLLGGRGPDGMLHAAVLARPAEL